MPDIGGDVFGHILQDGLGKLQPHADGLVFQNGHPGLVVGGVDLGQQAAAEPGLQTLVQAVHLFWRAVGGKDDLLFGVPEGVEGVEHLLLGGFTAGDELDVVHEEEVGVAVLVVKLSLSAVPDGLNQLVSERISLNVDDSVIGMLPVDLMGDGVHQVGLAQAGFAPNEEGIVAGTGGLGHRPGGGVGKFIGGAHHETVEGIVLAAGQEAGIDLAMVLLLIRLVHHLDLKVVGEEFPQGFLDGGDIAGGDDSTLELGRGAENKGIFIQGHGGGVAEPCLDGGGGHISLHQGEDLGPDLAWNVHGQPPETA